MDFKQANMVLSEATKMRVQETVTGTGTSQRVKNSLLAIEAQQKYTALKRWFDSNEFKLPLSPDLAPSPLVTEWYGEIETQRREVQALLLKYRDQHPKVQQSAIVPASGMLRVSVVVGNALSMGDPGELQTTTRSLEHWVVS